MSHKKCQSISCDVASCSFNDTLENSCTLSAIKVTPKMNCATEDIDESMCASYKSRALVDR
ncbi:MAG TPA: DUF1540 domain-containing protein [Clostridia bacterium]|nr:DUF1540 domain-containing protein [Clostridiaceae bacterium]HOA30364.1 DUF1540 domain-containing protein [Clostridia bacterium]HPZ53226.1 DUF1540 domain-containing protein [Clostridia bacterium]